MFKLVLGKAEEPETKLSTSAGIIEKAKEFQKNIYFCFIDYAKAFDCVDHNKLRKILKEMGIPDHLTCLLRNLYASLEATVRTRARTDWFQIRKGVHRGYLLSPCLFNICRVHHAKCQAGWHKLESRLWREISITSNTDRPLACSSVPLPFCKSSYPVLKDSGKCVGRK